MLWEEFYFFAGWEKNFKQNCNLLICHERVSMMRYEALRRYSTFTQRGERCDVGKENAKKIHHICNLNDVDAMWAEEICSKFLSLSRSAWLNPKSCNLNLTREIFVENSMNSRTQFCTFCATLEFNTLSHFFLISSASFSLELFSVCQIDDSFLNLACSKKSETYVYSRNNETLAWVSECEWNLLYDDDEFRERIVLKMEIHP